VTKQQSQGNHLGRDDGLRKQNAKFDQETADSRDHDKQSGKDQKKLAVPAGKKPKKS
jgi:hypothetical protein